MIWVQPVRIESAILFYSLWSPGLFLLTGLLAGLLSGLLGIGGGLVVVPALTLLGVPLHQAVGLSLVYILLTGSAGVWMHFRQGHIRGWLALALTLGGALCTLPGARISQALPSAWLAWLFVLLLGGIIALYLHKMLRPSSGLAHQSTPRNSLPMAILIGGLAGLLSAIFGVGGGFVMTPLLHLYLPLTLKESIGTSLAAIVLIALTAAGAHLAQGESSLWLTRWPGILALLGLGGILGAPLGARLTRIIPTRWLQWVLLGVLALVAGYMFLLGFKIS